MIVCTTHYEVTHFSLLMPATWSNIKGHKLFQAASLPLKTKPCVFSVSISHKVSLVFEIHGFLCSVAVDKDSWWCNYYNRL